jgi:hypothetical protein
LLVVTGEAAELITEKVVELGDGVKFELIV